MRVVVKGI